MRLIWEIFEFVDQVVRRLFCCRLLSCLLACLLACYLVCLLACVLCLFSWLRVFAGRKIQSAGSSLFTMLDVRGHL